MSLVSSSYTPNVTYNANNQVLTANGFSDQYDLAGDVTEDAKNSYLYDAEGRLCAVKNFNSVYYQYVYDAEGNRVAKGTRNDLTCPSPTSANNFHLQNEYLRDTNGQQVTELNGSSIWLHSNAFAGSILTTYSSTSPTFAFHLNDPLGSRRVLADASGNEVQTCQSLPFGDQLTCNGADPTEQHFTGKERDTESGNDYFGARYLASSMGRFLSPDPVVISPELDNPQTWNKYSYTFNRPLSLTDPDGKWPGWYHAELDRNFFGNQLHWSKHDQEVIVKESEHQDSWDPFDSFSDGQGTRNVRWHGMDNFWHQVGPEQAIADTESYITQSLNQAVYWQLRADYEGADCSSCHDAALRALADAEHAGQDLTSPEHRGKPWTMWGAAKHWYDERHSAMSSEGDDEMARAEAIYETQVINSRYQTQLAAARKKQHGPPSWNCLVNASCQ